MKIFKKLHNKKMKIKISIIQTNNMKINFTNMKLKKNNKIKKHIKKRKIITLKKKNKML